MKFLRISAAAPGRLLAAGALLAGGLLAGAPAAQAALGAGVASVESDRLQVGATRLQVAHAAFTVHELNTPGGGVVREYVSPAGVVFGISWHGPAMPNLRQVLGGQYPVLIGSTHRQAGGRGHLAVTEGPLVFESNGRMRSFHGRAFLSTALPAGVSTNDIQ